MTSGFIQLTLLEDGKVYEKINSAGKRLEEEFINIIKTKEIKICVNRVGSLVSLFFGIEEAEDVRSVMKSDTKLFVRYFGEMLSSGVYLAPSQFEAMFVSGAHTDEDIDLTLSKMESAVKKMREEGLF
jgi:glutamate-1-semialdehyde 2,1-aminomutase